MQRQMHLVGYVLVPAGEYVGQWRHPFNAPDFLERSSFESIARTLEAGCFDMIFMPDSITMPEGVGESYATAARTGIQGAIQIDAVLAMVAMAGVTRHIGLGATMSTTYVAPYNIARTMGTLDLLSGGRAAWNIVTSASSSQPQNFNLDKMPSWDERYDFADEVTEIVTGLWDSWEADALVLDKESGLFADPDRIHRLDYEGKHLKVRGPLALPRSKQGRPVLMQAGASDRGLTFGARWGEIVFAIQDSVESMRAFRDGIRERAAAQGRDPDTVKMVAAVQPIVGENEAIAREKQAFLRENVSIDGALGLMSTFSGTDLTRFPLSEPLDTIIAGVGGFSGRGTAKLLQQVYDRGIRTLGEAAREFGTSELTPQIVGSPEQVAEQMRDIFESEAVDGFVTIPASYPASYEEFVRGVVPVLQRMGVHRSSYRGPTLRDTLGLPAPELPR
jgi:FMN-dependent oxidoreductase (nitrilotriacetate monooxygenase family)